MDYLFFGYKIFCINVLIPLIIFLLYFFSKSICLLYNFFFFGSAWLPYFSVFCNILEAITNDDASVVNLDILLWCLSSTKLHTTVTVSIQHKRKCCFFGNLIVVSFFFDAFVFVIVLCLLCCFYFSEKFFFPSLPVFSLIILVIHK